MREDQNHGPRSANKALAAKAEHTQFTSQLLVLLNSKLLRAHTTFECTWTSRASCSDRQCHMCHRKGWMMFGAPLAATVWSAADTAHPARQPPNVAMCCVASGATTETRRQLLQARPPKSSPQKGTNWDDVSVTWFVTERTDQVGK